MKDATLGGYFSEHERPPAFEGPDGDSYTVEIIVEPAGLDDEGPWCGYLFFLKWHGSEPVGHVETEYLAEAATEAAARAELEKLALHEVKCLLDKLVSG
jgi:hypothetical protein